MVISVTTGMVDTKKKKKKIAACRRRIVEVSNLIGECAHILPFALSKFNGRDAQEVNHFLIMRIMNLASTHWLLSQ